MLWATQLDGFGSPSSKPASLSYAETRTSFTNLANATITFTTQAIGAPASNRYVAVALALNSSTSLTPTIGGVACTKVIGVNNGNFFAEIWISNVPIPSDTTADVVLAGTHLSNIRVAASTFALYGIASATAPQATGSDITSTYDIALSIPIGGVALGSCVVNQAATSWTWSSFTENVDAQLSPITYSSGSRSQAGSFTETVTPLAAGTSAFVAAVWGAP
jgi:hypothetical protein